ncbi:hypothetical protein NDU88_003509 [Pleurodeles waltl]|uniref:Uncharacterized protein n=1 Tax=Pleurodeles waltl TaxID=8319 RepID=A0AAV7RF48_PLEWA|nr:hypothetical protein NDU88_003509 [Pleurodeles waltl]
MDSDSSKRRPPSQKPRLVHGADPSPTGATFPQPVRSCVDPRKASLAATNTTLIAASLRKLLLFQSETSSGLKAMKSVLL